MKDTIISVITFCLALVIVTAIATLAFAVYLTGSKLFLFPVVTPEAFLTLVPVALRQVFLPSILLALFFALVRARRKPGLVFLSYVLLGGLAFAALYLGPRLVEARFDAEIARVSAGAAIRPRDLDYPRLLIPLKGAYLYFDRKEGGDLVDGFLVDTAQAPPRVFLFDRAALSAPDASSGGATRLALPPPAGSRILEPLAAESGPFTPDPTAQSVFGFFAALNDRYLALSGERSGAAVLVCLVFTLVVLSASVFLRVTRWPLANVFLALLVLALVLAFYHLLIEQFLVQAKKIVGESFWASIVPKESPLASLFGESFWLTVVPNGVLAFVSLVFFLFDFVFLPEKQREEPRA